MSHHGPCGIEPPRSGKQAQGFINRHQSAPSITLRRFSCTLAARWHRLLAVATTSFGLVGRVVHNQRVPRVDQCAGNSVPWVPVPLWPNAFQPWRVLTARAVQCQPGAHSVCSHQKVAEMWPVCTVCNGWVMLLCVWVKHALGALSRGKW